VRKKLSIALMTVLVFSIGISVSGWATGVTDNGAPAATVVAGQVNVLVMDFTVTDGGDTILNNHNGVDCAPGTLVIPWPGTERYVDNDGSGAYDLGDEVYLDDDADGVYTAAADVRIDTDGTITAGVGGAPDAIVAGTAFNTFLATDFVYFVDNVVADGLYTPGEDIGIDIDQDGWTDNGLEEILTATGNPWAGPIVIVTYAPGSSLRYNDTNTNGAYDNGEDIFDATGAIPARGTYSALPDTYVNAGIDTSQDAADGQALLALPAGLVLFDQDNSTTVTTGDEIGTDADNNGAFLDVLNAITLRNLGTALDTTDIAAGTVTLYMDDGDGVFQFGAPDTAYAALAWDGDSWVQAAVGQNILGVGVHRFYVGLDIRAAAATMPVDGRTIQMGIPALVDVNSNGAYNANDEGIFFASKDDTGGIANPAIQTIVRPVTLTDSTAGPNVWWYETITNALAAARLLGTTTPYYIDAKAGVYDAAGPNVEVFPLELNVNNLVVRGAQVGIDPTPAGARQVAANESIIDCVGANIAVRANTNAGDPNGTGVTFDGFTVQGDNVTAGRAIYANRTGPVIRNNIIKGFTSNAIFLVAEHSDITAATIQRNLVTGNNIDWRGLITVEAYTAWNISNVQIGGSGNKIDGNNIPANEACAITIANSGTGTVGPVTIAGNYIASNTTNGRGVQIFNHAGILGVTLTNNTITKNLHGVLLGAAYDSSQIAAASNQIYGNTSGVTNNDVLHGDADFRNNWWGHVTGAFHAVKNPGGQGDSVTDYVDIIPYWTSPAGGITTAAYTYSNGAGFYGMSVPLLPADPTPAAVYDEIGPAVTVYGAYSYEDGPAYAGVNVNPNIDPERGTWLYLLGNTTITVEGTEVASPEQLDFPTAGWYMISAPWTTDWNTAAFTGTFHAEAAGNALWASNYPTGGYAVKYSGSQFILDPWQSYWVKVLTAPATIIFTKSTLPPTPHSLAFAPMGLHAPTVSPPPPPALQSGGISVELSNSAAGFHFLAAGPALSLRAKILSVDGALIAETTAAGNELVWSMKTSAGELVANGVYLIQISAETYTGWVDLGLFRVLVLR
jgi:hypothetical protein